MAKTKAPSNAVVNRPAYSRVSFLYQAAAFLAAKAPSTDAQAATPAADDGAIKSTATPHPSDEHRTGMSRRLLTQMRAISRKTNMRLRPAVKQRVCKYCDTLLVEGSTCASVVENQSRCGRKAWADVLAVTCTTCGRVRRYPVSAERQPRRPYRGPAGEELRKQEEAAQLKLKQGQKGQKPAKQPQQNEGQKGQKPVKQSEQNQKGQEPAMQASLDTPGSTSGPG